MDTKSLSFISVKGILFLFNLFFAFTGLILLMIGIVIKTYYSGYEPFLDDRYFSASSLLIASGTIIFIIAFFGCCGAIKENRCMIITFTVLLSVVMIIEFASGVTAYVLSSETNELLNNKLNQTMYEYTSRKEISFLWDTVQTEFKCCGLNNASDWQNVFKNSSLPVSCCSFDHGTLDTLTCNLTSKSLYHDSCETQLGKEVKRNTTLLGIVAFSIIGIQILGILFSWYLSRAIRSSNYETV